MKKVFSLCFSMLLLAPSLWASSSGGITVHLKNGQKVSFLFSQQPKMTTASNELAILVNEVKQVSYDYTEVKKVELDKSLTTDLKATGHESGTTTFAFGDGQIHVSGLTSGDTVSIHSADGRTVFSANVTADGTLSIPVSQLPQGVCIINTQGGISYKFYNN